MKAERKWIKLIGKVIKRYKGHNLSSTSAYMAYYWLLAFFPFLIFIISLLTYTKIPVDILMEYVGKIVPNSSLPIIETTIHQFILNRSTTILSVGGLITLWTAGTAVNALIRGIHIAYNSKYIKPYLVARVMAVIYTVLLAMLIILIMIGLVYGNKIGDYLFSMLDMNKGIFMPIWNLTRLIMPFVALVIILYIIYKIIPRRFSAKHRVWPGVVFTSVSWYLFSLFFSIYVDNYSKYNQLYGSIGSVFIILIWLYGGCTLLLLGAEINSAVEELEGEPPVRRFRREQEQPEYKLEGWLKKIMNKRG